MADAFTTWVVRRLLGRVAVPHAIIFHLGRPSAFKRRYVYGWLRPPTALAGVGSVPASRCKREEKKNIQILQFSLHALPGQCCQQAVITRKVVPDYKNKWQRKKYRWIDSMRHNWPMTRVLSQRLYLTKPRRVVKKKNVSIIYILITRYNDLGTRSHLGVYLCYTLYTCLLSTSRV